MSHLPEKPIRFLTDVDRIVDDAFAALIHEPWGRRAQAWTWRPPIDLYQTDDAYLVVVDAPGVAPQQIHVFLDGNDLLIQGKRDQQFLARAGASIRLEREYGEFCRRIPLAHAVDLDRIEVRGEHGQLIVRVPKRAGRADADSRPARDEERNI